MMPEGETAVPAKGRSRYRNGPTRPPKDVHMVVMEGDIDKVLDQIKGQSGLPVNVVERCLDILIGLSLKGYEGRAIGAIYLIGDVEGVRMNTTQMIINPFKGWSGISIMDPAQLPTFEAYTQLDGAILFDRRGFARSAGLMIHLKGWQNAEPSGGDLPQSTKGRGTRWRAAKYITSVTGTIAITLSHSGDIAVFLKGREMGRMERRIKRISPEQARSLFGLSC